MQQTRRYHTYPDTLALQADLVQRIHVLANACIEAHGIFRIVLSGGSTPRDIYRALTGIETDWSAWQVYFGDERCLPAGDPERNDKMAQDVWLQYVAIPISHIHVIPAELGAEPAAQAYERMLSDVEGFDLVLLGLGEDGHTASLFPGHQHDALSRVVAVTGSPKPPPQRVSLTASMLSRSEQVWFIACGNGKQIILQQWHDGVSMPASTIQPRNGVDIFTDVSLSTAT